MKFFYYLLYLFLELLVLFSLILAVVRREQPVTRPHLGVQGRVAGFASRCLGPLPRVQANADAPAPVFDTEVGRKRTAVRLPIGGLRLKSVIDVHGEHRYAAGDVADGERVREY